jgi:hypothetical protein
MLVSCLFCQRARATHSTFTTRTRSLARDGYSMPSSLIPRHTASRSTCDDDELTEDRAKETPSTLSILANDDISRFTFQPVVKSVSSIGSPTSVVSPSGGLDFILEEADISAEQVPNRHLNDRGFCMDRFTLQKNDIEQNDDDANEATDSSVFGSLADSTTPNTAILGKDTNFAHHRNTTPFSDNVHRISQSQLVRVLRKAACQTNTWGGDDRESYFSRGSSLPCSTETPFSHRPSTNFNSDSKKGAADKHDEDLESIDNSILDLSSVGSSRVKQRYPKERDPTQRSSTGLHSPNESDGIQPKYINVEERIQQGLMALQKKKQESADMFQRASQGLKDDLQRAHGLVQTLEEQLDRAFRRREEALQRYEGAHANRNQQVAADAVRTLHLEIVQHCLSTFATRKMIEAPMPISCTPGDASQDITFTNMSVLDRALAQFATLSIENDSDVNSSQYSTGSSNVWYQELSVEELKLMKMRLESILDLFHTAQRRKDSTNLRWQAQADAMKHDAASKYVLYCQYGQI